MIPLTVHRSFDGQSWTVRHNDTQILETDDAHEAEEFAEECEEYNAGVRADRGWEE